MHELIAYYVTEATTPPRLMRRIGHVDEAFWDGAWHPTKWIIDYEFGYDNRVDGPITEEEARAIAPDAFA